MIILKKEISKPTEQFVLMCYEHITGHIEYGVLSKELAVDRFGLANIIGDGRYQIALRSDLPKEAFETNLCHELYHLVQVSNGFPMIFPKLNGQEHKSLITSINSLVLDLNVYNALKEKSIDNTYFTKKRYQQARSEFINANPKDYLDLPAEDVFKVSLLLFGLDDVPYNEITCLIENANKRLLEEALQVKEIIETHGFSNPLECFNSFGYILSHYKFWSLFKIKIGAGEVKTKRQFEDYTIKYQQNQ